jgi:hypothetical protein
MMAEMSEHTGEVETGDPFPGVLMLARAYRFWRSKGKDPASELGQSRRADHDFTHGYAVLQLKMRENRPLHPPKWQTLRWKTPQRFNNNRSGSRRHCSASLCSVMLPYLVKGEKRGRRTEDVRTRRWEQSEKRGLAKRDARRSGDVASGTIPVNAASAAAKAPTRGRPNHGRTLRPNPASSIAWVRDAGCVPNPPRATVSPTSQELCP